ncbi:NEDD8-conjugating protein ubc12 [Monosporozyma unispora]|nr:NEDD8-conjugating protein ubc12 [Kazachstania unispora]
MLSPARMRLEKDIENLDLPPTVTVDIINAPSNLNERPLLYIFISPDDGYYDGGRFKFSLIINENYPIDAPKLLCLDKIYHPNIDLDGKICLNILREDWRPVLDLQAIIIGLLFLFLEPNAQDPLNKEAAQILNNDKFQFKQMVNISMSGQIINNVKYDDVL